MADAGDPVVNGQPGRVAPIDTDANYLRPVREQYEVHPYPPRDPEDERQRLIRVVLAELSAINHHGFGGWAPMDRFRVLVAGAGTGDATIALAEQLTTYGARVTSLDISAASSTIARARAQVRGLDNIDWVHGSLLDLPQMGLDPFHYINCCGVLHHLADPDAGLAALRDVLTNDGMVGLMLYGGPASTGLTHMQELLRTLTRDLADVGDQIRVTREVMAALPDTHSFRHNAALFVDAEDSDAGLVDMLLHSQERTYTVDQVHRFVADAGLHFGGFSDPTDRWRLDATHLVKNTALRQHIRGMDPQTHAAVMELYTGAVIRHCFFATRRPDAAARIADTALIPYRFRVPDAWATGFSDRLERAYHDAGPGLPEVVVSQDTRHFLSVRPGPYSHLLLRHMDGERSVAALFDTVRTQAKNTGATAPDDDALMTDLEPLFTAFHRMDLMFLRHPSIPAFPE